MSVSGSLLQQTVKSLGFPYQGFALFRSGVHHPESRPTPRLYQSGMPDTLGRGTPFGCRWCSCATFKLKGCFSADRGFAGLDGALTETAYPGGSAPNLERVGEHEGAT